MRFGLVYWLEIVPHQTPELSVVRALDASWPVRVTSFTQDANRCAGVVVSNWTLCQFSVRRG